MHLNLSPIPCEKDNVLTNIDHVGIDTRAADTHGLTLVGYLERRAEQNNVTS